MKCLQYLIQEILILIGEVADIVKKASFISRILMLMFDTSLG